MMEWIRYIAAAVLMGFGLFCFLSAVIGNLRFGFVLNRIHSAGTGDTLGLLSIVLSLAAASGLRMETLKLILVLVFVWIGSPVSTHFLSQVEYYLGGRLQGHVRDERTAGRGDKKEADSNG